ncbi:MAG: BON domain-containing protein, partial [Actinomycetia bacterium]|nr:BON domain-containing protein [Actinomycetes bacterium]
MLKSKKRGIADVARYTSGRPSASASFGQDAGDDDVMSSIGFAAAVIVGFLIIAFLAVRFGTTGIEADLEAKARQSLVANGFTEVNVEASGTSLRLSGSITTEQAQDDAYATVAQITGVGTVSGSLWPVSTGELQEIIVTGDAIDITWNGNEAIVSGSVSSTEKLVFVDETLSSTFTNGVDVTGLSALEGLEDETRWLGTTLSLVQRFADALTAGRVVVDPNAELLTVVGETEDKALRDELNDLATEAGAGFG